MPPACVCVRAHSGGFGDTSSFNEATCSRHLFLFELEKSKEIQAGQVGPASQQHMARCACIGRKKPHVIKPLSLPTLKVAGILRIRRGNITAPLQAAPRARGTVILINGAPDPDTEVAACGWHTLQAPARCKTVKVLLLLLA